MVLHVSHICRILNLNHFSSFEFEILNFIFELFLNVQVKKMVEEAMAKHGLKSANKRAKIKEDLWEEMEEALLEQVCCLCCFHG